MIYKKVNSHVIDILNKGGVGVIPTDTVYGIVASAFNKKAVERIYNIKNRDREKPFIILISSANELRKFGIKRTKKLDIFLRKLWPGSVSVIIPCPDDKFNYLHRGKKSLAFRAPEPLWLRRFLRETGPLVAPSANVSDKKFALSVKEAKEYFGRNVDFYLDKGKSRKTPSILIKLMRM